MPLRASGPFVEKEIVFTNTGNGAPYLGDGWHGLESSHVWSGAQFAHLQLAESKELLFKSTTISITIKSLATYPFDDPKNIAVMFQGENMGEIRLNGDNTTKLTFPVSTHDQFNPTATVLRLEIPNWNHSPLLQGEGGDPRSLGIALQSIKIVFNLDLELPQDLPWTTEAGTVLLKSFPTIGNGNCFFHAGDTEPAEPNQVVDRKAADKRAKLCDAVQRGEFLEELKPLVYEHYLERLADDPYDQTVPAIIRETMQKKDRYTAMYAAMQEFQIPTELVERPEEKFTDAMIKNLVPADAIKLYMERYRNCGGERTYIPIRPGIIDPADIIAQQSGKTFNVFTFNTHTKSLQLLKTVGIAGPVINMLIHGPHFIRLMDPANAAAEEPQCTQVMLNHATVKYGH